MRMAAVIIVLCFGGCSSGYESVINCYSTSQFRKFSTPSFSSYFMNVRSGSQSRIDIYIQMPYKNIRFEKTYEGFKASYSLAYIIRNDKKEIIQTKEVDRPIVTRTYEETVSPRFDFHLQPFVTAPGDYDVEVIATDNLSQLRYTHRESLAAKDYSDSNNVASSILFLNTMLVNEKGISLRPIMPSSLSMLTDSVGIFQELYNIGLQDSIRITVEYRSPHGEEPSERSFSYLMPPYRASAHACEREYDSVYFRKDSVFAADRAGTLHVFQFYPLPSVGSSIIERSISVKRIARMDSARFSGSIFRRSKRFLSSLSDTEVTDAMRYILREQEYDSLVSAAGEDLEIKLGRFWEQHGGFERRAAFERKIAEANALFTTCMDGSRSAMGIVYIVCGTPDVVDCRGTFSESWIYNVGDRAFSIEFRRTGEHTTTYELMPFSVNESVWQYFVDRWRRDK